MKQILPFLQEILQRLKHKSPRFFQIFNVINGLLALFAGIPAILTEFDIILPPHWAAIVLKLAGMAGGWGWIMTKLTVQRDPVTDTDGQVLQNSKAALPFTKKAEQKLVDKVLK